MGCEWNNGNCRGGFGTRPYHPHNCNRNCPSYESATTMTTGIVPPLIPPPPCANRSRYALSRFG
jgi:hypothetical protein